MAKESLPRLTQAQIRELATEQSFERGELYYRQGAIFNAMRQGLELRADCQGSTIYHVQAKLNQQGLESSRCTCPYDWGGLCKHQVALLLTYIHDPQQFQVIPPMSELLAAHSREDLVALIGRMIQRHPELLYLVELSAPHPANQPMEMSTYRRKAQQALRREDPEEIAEGLQGLMEAAKHLLERGDWLNAGALYHLLLEELTVSYDYEMFEIDYDGDVACITQDAIAGLNQCLSKAQDLDAQVRRDWLTALFEAELKDLELGGIDFAAGASEALLAWATDEDWEWLEPQIRDAIAKHDRWAKEQLVNLLAQRQQQSGRGQAASDLIHELGTPEQRAFLLVEEGKFEDAIAIAEESFSHLPGLVTQFADALLKANRSDLALQWISQQQTQNPRYGYKDWLSQFHRTHGHPELALTMDYEEFQAHPSFPRYLELRKFAQSLGAWDELHSKIIQQLEQSKQTSLLIDIAVEEGEGDRAWQLLRSDPRSQFTRAEVVAKAIEATHPQDAIALYNQLANRFIEQRNRGAYQSAASYLKRVKALHEATQTQEDWRSTIQQIRTKYARLPALQDELNRAGL
ncbi:SWIM zinc finger family protein [Leptodesmis sichuanensis]|uniref:SWIM zinc finger family protein n=1 Tax=Leptodesmis sichuanensis TaxID=2906798 RepID=UPI001F41A8CC|nr:SWIM zinc finger family protein [Leptodesmis sichuanensis]UIE36477.1 SWIM zinc finger family protein [Leptodesmis sichuanensis A121]